jgi:hypothetical protein
MVLPPFPLLDSASGALLDLAFPPCDRRQAKAVPPCGVVSRRAIPAVEIQAHRQV